MRNYSVVHAANVAVLAAVIFKYIFISRINTVLYNFLFMYQKGILIVLTRTD